MFSHMHKKMKVSVSGEHLNITKITDSFHNHDRVQIFTLNNIPLDIVRYNIRHGENDRLKFTLTAQFIEGNSLTVTSHHNVKCFTHDWSIFYPLVFDIIMIDIAFANLVCVLDTNINRVVFSQPLSGKLEDLHRTIGGYEIWLLENNY